MGYGLYLTRGKERERERVMAKHDKVGNSITRKISETWTLESGYRVKVYTYHDKSKKAYWAIIKECQVEESGTSGLYFERHALHSDLNRLIEQTLATRYAWHKLEQAHNIAVEKVQDLISQLLESHLEKESA